MIKNLSKLSIKLNKPLFIENMCQFNTINNINIIKNNNYIIPATGGVDSSTTIIKYNSK